jgi:hypothetical protein
MSIKEFMKQQIYNYHLRTFNSFFTKYYVITNNKTDKVLIYDILVFFPINIDLDIFYNILSDFNIKHDNYYVYGVKIR